MLECKLDWKASEFFVFVRNATPDSYLLRAPPNGQVRHKAFLRWVRAQGQSPHFLKIPTALSAFPLLGASGNKPNPSEGGKSLGGYPPRPKEITSRQATPDQIRAWPDPRLTRARPIDWSASQKPYEIGGNVTYDEPLSESTDF